MESFAITANFSPLNMHYQNSNQYLSAGTSLVPSIWSVM